MRPIVFVPEPISASGMDLLKTDCDIVAPWQEGHDLGPAQMKSVLHGLSRALKVIGKHGVGVDNIDCAAATQRRIPVVYTPTANANAVAEHAVALMLALARDIYPASAALREGLFGKKRFEGVELAGKVLGVVGLGRIGARVAEMAKFGFGMDVRGYDPFLTAETYSGPATLTDSVDELLAQSDFVTLHLPLTPETKHLINAQRLATMKPACRIINTSRGAVIDEAALAAALHDKTIAGAALDVFESEPLPADHPLCLAPNALLTPHISSSTRESLDRMAAQSALGVLDVLQGRQPQYLVNPEAYG